MSMNVKDVVQLAAQWGPFAMTALKELREIDSSYRVPQKLHDVEMDANQEHHRKEIKLQMDQHKGERMLSQQLFFMQTYTEFQRQAVQLDADLVNAQKEAERDMYDQRNHQLQTLVVSVTVMFAALSTVMVEGKLNDNVSIRLKTAFAVCNGISFAFLFVCLVLCIELLILASRFMVNKAKNRFRKQDRARKEFQDENEKFTLLYEEQTSVYSGAEQSKDSIINDPLWGKKIESASDDLIQKRRDINGTFISKEKETFEFFWDNYCEYEAGWAIICFYMGTGFMLISIVLYMLGSNSGVGGKGEENTLIGGYVGSVFIIFSLCFGIWLAWRTQKIYAGEWKIRVKLHSPKEHDGPKGFFRCAQEWKDGKIVEVHDDGHHPTFRVAYGDKSAEMIDNVPLRNLRLLKQKGIVKNMTDKIKKKTNRRRKQAGCEKQGATYATPIDPSVSSSRSRWSARSAESPPLKSTNLDAKESKLSDDERLARTECHVGGVSLAESSSDLSVETAEYRKMSHIV